MTLLPLSPALPRQFRAWTTGSDRARFAVGQAVLLAVAVAVYFGVRSLTAGSAGIAHSHADAVVALERSLGIFVERDVQSFVLQLDAAPRVLNAVYIYGHWPVIAVVLGWLAWRRRDAYVVYRNALLISGVVGMLIVATFPVAPPRLMDLGFVDTVTLHSEAYRLLQPPSFTNQYAAMPSFHVGWDLLVGIALVREGGRRWTRVVGTVLPGLMLLTVVATGNHYLLDAVVGDAIVLSSLWLSRWAATRWHHRTRDREPQREQPAPRPQAAAAGQGPDRPRVRRAA
jgi:hypothetical protein